MTGKRHAVSRHFRLTIREPGIRSYKKVVLNIERIKYDKIKGVVLVCNLK